MGREATSDRLRYIVPPHSVRQWRGLLTAVLLLTGWHLIIESTADAATRPRKYSVSKDGIPWQVTHKGAVVWCFTLPNGRTVSGKFNKKGNFFVPDSTKSVDDAIKAAKKRRQTKLVKSLKKKKAKQTETFADRAQSCVDQSTPTPTPPTSDPGTVPPTTAPPHTSTPESPTPSPIPPTATPIPGPPDEISLEPAGALSTAQIDYLAEKAGLGRDLALHALTGRNAAAVVSEFIRIKPENQELLSRVTDRLDEKTLNTPAEIPTVTGARRALIDLMINSANPFRQRLLHLFLRQFSVDGCALSTSGTAIPGANPRQTGAYWAYVELLQQGANTPAVKSLVRDVGQSVAFLVGHSANLTSKALPPERYAQLLLDRLTVGSYRYDAAGNRSPVYTMFQTSGDFRSDDVAIVARRLTGWGVNLITTGVGTNREWSTFYNENSHASGPETIFAGTSNAKTVERDSDLINALFQNPAASEYWARVLLQEFLTPEPPYELVTALSQRIAAANFNLEGPLQTLLASKAFYHSRYVNTVYKNPLELTVETIRLLGLEAVATRDLTTIDSWIASPIFTTNTAAEGTGFNFVCPASSDYFPRNSWSSGAGLLALFKQSGRILERARLEAAKTSDALWDLNSAIPAGSLSVPNLTTVGERLFGVKVSEDQFIEMAFMLNFVADTTNPRFVEYNNEVDNSATLGRAGKGLALWGYLLNMPAFLLR